MRISSAHARSLCLLLVCTVLAVACHARPEPEEALRQTIAQATEAAEKRDVGALSGLLAADYRDGQGRDRRAANRNAVRRR